MVVLRRLDALLEPGKDKVMEELAFQRDEAGFTEWDEAGLRDASGYVFYNTSEWTLQRLYDTATNNQQILQGNVEDYLKGFSANVKEIIEKFKLARQIRHMASKDVLLDVLEKFTSPNINLTPFDKDDPEGRKMPALTNLGMGYVFEELIRKFNEENNEEAGEHFTPREVIDLMTHIIFEPVKDRLPPVMTIYDPACGSGGMLTESQNFVKDQNGGIQTKGDVYLYGKEINDETYAICKSDMMIKGNDPENIRVGSTLSTDEFAGTRFDFMLSNPPYGKSWSTEVKYIKDGKDIIDPRFVVRLKDYWGNEEEAPATPRSSDGQLLFLMEMVNKMKPVSQTPLGSRIASVHNGSSLFTGDAGGGESNIRRYIIENDMLEAIIQLPNNLFYNTGITTYIWVLSNNKEKRRKGKVQLIDASDCFGKLRKNLGNKNCELRPEHIRAIQKACNDFTEVRKEEDGGLAVKIFDNSDFGYYKVPVERPRRLKAQFTHEAVSGLRFDKTLKEPMEWAFETYGKRIYTELPKLEKEILDWCEKNEFDLDAKKRKTLCSSRHWEKQRALMHHAQTLQNAIGNDEHKDFNKFQNQVEKVLKAQKITLTASEKNAIYGAITSYDESAEKVIKKQQKLKGDKLENLLEHLGCTAEQLPDFGYYPGEKKDEYITYESESDLRDSENVPLKESVYDYFLREVKPHADEAWIDLEKIKIGYEISFNKYFYRHNPLRSIEEVSVDMLELEQESEGLIMDILGVVN
ncbi:SAM-dependent DNA methylase [Desulfonema limicola]|uniref:site-specific DNA-methyltransferase (adenine-specific) n=2 Tax=Desulfonema limicola TaxID=45656 RepID=A0A975GEE2_9BACT|nr:SAM-dependent DNA methylase [Desulfonema limicola]